MVAEMPICWSWHCLPVHGRIAQRLDNPTPRWSCCETPVGPSVLLNAHDLSLRVWPDNLRQVLCFIKRQPTYAGDKRQVISLCLEIEFAALLVGKY